MAKFKVLGKIVVKETGTGIPGLIVHAFDLDQPGRSNQTSISPEEMFDRFTQFDNLGSVLTSKDGSFSIEFDETDFNISEGKDFRPEIYLIVSRPEDEDEKPGKLSDITLYLSRAIRYKAGKTESYHIRILKETLDRFGINYPQPDFASAANDNISPTYLLKAIHQKAASKKQFNQGIKLIDEKINEKVEADFASFQLSKFKPEIQNSLNYLKPQDSLQEKQELLITDKLTKLSANGSSKSIKFKFTQAELNELELWSDGRPISGRIPKSYVKKHFKKNTLESRPFEPCLKTFSESNLTSFDSVPEPPLPPAGAEPEPNLPSIDNEIEKQLSTATSPETALKYEKVIDPDYKNDRVCETVNQLMLCGGPADVTSYHDFHTIQIAFEHVWTEFFDKKLISTARELHGNILKEDEGYSEFSRNVPDDLGPFLPFYLWEYSTVDDLAKLIENFSRESSSNPYIRDLVGKLQQRLSEKYQFTVFAPHSINYGVVFTFRQKWEPVNYQVGKLVSSLPLAPKEVRKYSSKRVTLKSKNEKYLDDREFKGKTESTSTSRAESEIIKRATNNTSFGINTNASVNMEMFEAGVQTNLSNTSEKFSQETKKNFREAVMNAVEEYRKQNKTEIEFGWRDELTTESSGEISNPNDEITVTYLFYELQRQYDISEHLHKIQPVVMVANEVPMPDEIDDDWLMANAWILKRVILDESFIPTINQLTISSVGDNLALTNLKSVKRNQEEIVRKLSLQIETKNKIIENLFGRLENLAVGEQAVNSATEIFNIGRSILDPIGSMLGGMGGGAPTLDTIKEFTQMALERAEKESKELSSALNREQSYFQQITEKYNKELQQYFDRQTALMQLRIHIKENILYYMQCIWDYEPPDQRYFRLYNLEIEWFEAEVETGYFEATVVDSVFGPRMHPGERYELEVHLPPAIRRTSERRRLIEIADLDKLLGYKGNYMIFPVNENSYLHEFMIQEFIDNATGGIKDADDFANYKTQDLIDYLKCVRRQNPEAYEREKDRVIALINERIQSTRKEKERVVIPTSSLFIESLPGKHPVMEDFKLAHRSLDVKKVQAEIRHAELENIRLAARLIEGEREDPDIEKIVIKK